MAILRPSRFAGEMIVVLASSRMASVDDRKAKGRLEGQRGQLNGMIEDWRLPPTASANQDFGSKTSISPQPRAKLGKDDHG